MEDDLDFLADIEIAEPQADNIEEGMMDNTEVVEETTEPSEVEGNQGETVQEPFLKIKYNKEERGLSIDEAIELSQKGMNYDKLQERLNQFENNRGLQYLNELARRSNTDIDSLVDYWQQQEEQQKLNELIQNNIPQELAEEILEGRRDREERQKKEQEQQKQENQNKQFKEFFDAFPGVMPEQIPQEVWDKYDNGMPLKHAYMEFENAKLRNELNILKTNQTNKTKAPKLGTTTYGSHDVTVDDPFLEGFNSI